MSITTTAEQVYRGARIFLADPVSGTPTQLPGNGQVAINKLWGYLLYGGAIVAAFAAAGCCIMLWNSRGGGSQNEHLGKLGLVFAGALGLSMVAGIVGAVTGT